MSSSTIKSLPAPSSGARMPRKILAATSICILLLALNSILTISASSSSSATAPSGASSSSSPSSNANLTNVPPSKQTGDAIKTQNSKANGNTQQQQQQVTIIDPQQQQSTDLSSMYVQIPIAEPGDTGVPDGVQQTLSSDPDSPTSGDQKASSWTGPWPKKFQIGYIKQSDLHQVLIESLKNDPFVSLTGSQTSTKIPTPSPTPAPTSAASPQVALNSGTKTSAQTKSTTTSSDSSSLMSSGQQKAANAQWPSSGYGLPLQSSQRLQHPQQMAKNIYHHQPISHNNNNNNFRDQKLLEQSFNQQMQRYQRQLANFNQARPFHHQTHSQPQKLVPMTNLNSYLQQKEQQPQQQFQFAGFPSSMFKNQPIYTINNYPPQQEQLDPNSMQLMMGLQQQQQQIQFPGPMLQPGQNLMSTTPSRPLKSADYYSSWKPVTNDDKQEQVPAKTNGLGQFQADSFSNINDDFEDGFSAPSKDAAAAGAMNRHPMLNNYLGSQSDLNKLSPVMKMKQQQQQQQRGEQEGTKSSSATTATAQPQIIQQQQQQSATKGATRTSGDSSTGGTKSGSPTASQQPTKGSDSNMNLSTGRRRASNNNQTSTATTSTTSPSTTTDGQQTSTASTPAASGDDANSTTTLAPTTTSSASTMILSTTTLDTETAEPDSEVIESETTEPSSGSTTTTTVTSDGSSTASQETSSQASTDNVTTVRQQDAGESEVNTEGSVQQQQTGTAKLPTLNSSAGDESASTEVNGSGNSREETTPSSGLATDSSDATRVGAAAGSKGGEMEDAKRQKDSMSDEALLAAARNGADIGKTQSMNLQQQRQLNASSSNKKIRSSSSSERLVQSEQSSSTASSVSPQAARRKSNPNSSNKLITKKPSAGARAAKQVSSADSGTKGASSKLSATRSNSKSNKKRLAPKQAAKGAAASGKSTRTTNQQQNDRLRTPTSPQTIQILSMTAAQAQSTAQTLASLLLARCLTSNGCAHLLDVCATKQAVVAMPSNLTNQLENNASDSNSNGNGNTSAWSLPVGLMSGSIMALAQALQADKVLKVFPQWKEAVENVVDHDPQTGYTLILPSNEAIDRIPMATMDAWLANPELMGQIIDNHMTDSAELIEFGTNSATNSDTSNGRRPQFGAGRSRVIRSKGLQVNQYREKMVTINGKRLVYANQVAPSGGRIHVIDGVFDWSASNGGQAKLLDIMDTLKQCDKFDGFVTLAEGTGLTQILKQDGPMTVFVPSNEALRKIPDEELEVIKNNSTALKEFLMYHVVNGSYFSQDLRDGQQLSSILDMKPIQVGVRVDGCSRRLVEANTSPMRRPDIVAKNGVIHILDWYLTVRDNDWCDQSVSRQPILDTASVASSSAPSSPSSSLANSNSERLQQLASESTATVYATRMSMPPNHKAAQVITPAKQHNEAQANPLPFKMATYEPAHNIIVSATPLK